MRKLTFLEFGQGRLVAILNVFDDDFRLLRRADLNRTSVTSLGSVAGELRGAFFVFSGHGCWGFPAASLDVEGLRIEPADIGGTRSAAEFPALGPRAIDGEESIKCGGQ